MRAYEVTGLDTRTNLLHALRLRAHDSAEASAMGSRLLTLAHPEAELIPGRCTPLAEDRPETTA